MYINLWPKLYWQYNDHENLFYFSNLEDVYVHDNNIKSSSVHLQARKQPTRTSIGIAVPTDVTNV